MREGTGVELKEEEKIAMICFRGNRCEGRWMTLYAVFVARRESLHGVSIHVYTSKAKTAWVSGSLSLSLPSIYLSPYLYLSSLRRGNQVTIPAGGDQVLGVEKENRLRDVISVSCDAWMEINRLGREEGITRLRRDVSLDPVIMQRLFQGPPAKLFRRSVNFHLKSQLKVTSDVIPSTRIISLLW